MNGVHLCHIVVDQHGPMFDDVVVRLSEAIERLGHPVTSAVNALSPSQLNVLVGAAVMLDSPACAEVLESGMPFVLFQAEALADTAGFLQQSAAYWQLIAAAAQVWDYSPTNGAFLQARGVADVRVIPLGHLASLKAVRPALQQDIDVLFFGSLSPRRQKLLARLRDRGLNVESRFGVYGAELDDLLARSKVVLNVHQFDLPHLEVLRIAYLLNKGCCVVSETGDHDPYPGGVLFAEFDQLPEVCADLVQPGRDADRYRLAYRGECQLRAVNMPYVLRQALSKFFPDL